MLTGIVLDDSTKVILIIAYGQNLCTELFSAEQLEIVTPELIDAQLSISTRVESMCNRNIVKNCRTAETNRFRNFHVIFSKSVFVIGLRNIVTTHSIQNDSFKYTETYHPYSLPGVSSGQN